MQEMFYKMFQRYFFILNICVKLVSRWLALFWNSIYYSLVCFSLMHIFMKEGTFTLTGTAEFLKLNPLGYVPVLVDGDIVVSDSLAILLVHFFLHILNVSIYVALIFLDHLP